MEDKIYLEVENYMDEESYAVVEIAENMLLLNFPGEVIEDILRISPKYLSEIQLIVQEKFEFQIPVQAAYVLAGGARRKDLKEVIDILEISRFEAMEYIDFALQALPKTGLLAEDYYEEMRQAKKQLVNMPDWPIPDPEIRDQKLLTYVRQAIINTNRQLIENDKTPEVRDLLADVILQSAACLEPEFLADNDFLEALSEATTVELPDIRDAIKKMGQLRQELVEAIK